MTVYKVKGSSIKSKFAYVEQQFGANAMEVMKRHFVAKYGANTIPALSNVWYPYGIFVDVLEHIANTFYNGDFSKLELVGASSAQDALNTIYRSFMQTDYFDFLRRLTKLHHVFYNMGKSEIFVHENRKGCDIIQSGKPKYARADLYVASGFYQETARLHSLKNVRGEFTPKVNSVHFTLTWS